jgi:transcriptional regulator with GAF, ATPase, and Fis domain
LAIDPAAFARSISRLEELDPLAVGLQVSLEASVKIVDELFAVDGAGLMVLSEDEVLRYAAASDERGRQLELIQEQTGEGPCIHAFDTNAIVTCHDAANDERYPRFAELAPRHGIGAVLGIPLSLKGITVGTLNVYATQPHEWGDAETKAIEGFSTVIAAILRVAANAGLAEETAGQLQFALDHRVLVEQAKGILMERDGLDPAAAFERLRGAARANRVKLIDVARSLIEGVPLERLGR